VQPTATVPEQLADPAARAAFFMNKLTSSGASNAAWTHDVRALADRWQRELPRELTAAARFDSMSCYAAGCALPVRYGNAGEQEAFERSLREHALLAWKGYIHRTSPAVGADGSVTATWLFMSPED
jgi:hypothetical protein